MRRHGRIRPTTGRSSTVPARGVESRSATPGSCPPAAPRAAATCGAIAPSPRAAAAPRAARAQGVRLPHPRSARPCGQSAL